MNTKHKELLNRFETRSKELNDFLAASGDNITSADYTKATAIRDDLKTIRSGIEECKQHEGLVDEARQFRSYVEDPATGHRHSAEVVGHTPAGETELEIEYDGPKGKRSNSFHTRARVKSILNERGSGILGKVGNEGYSSRAASAIQTREYRNAMRAYFRTGRMPDVHVRTLEDGLDPQGGYLAPVENIAKLIEKKATPTRVSELCSIINSSRDAIALPRVNYTTASDDALGNIYSTGFRATLTDENPTSATQANVNDTNIFGSVRVSIYTWLIEGVLTNNQVEDAMFDPLVWLSGKFDETVRLLKDNVAINGVNGGPAGLLSNPGAADTLSFPSVIFSGAAASPFLTPDGLINLSEDIPEQYDNDIRYLYKKTSTGKTIRTFKDGNGRYLFGTGVQDSGLMPGRVREINGYPTIMSQFMPDPAASAYPVAAGDFGGITMVNRIGYSVQVLREIAARQNQIVVLGRVRFGVQVLEPWRLRVQQCHA
jgi:HK97 family phage major capsid protein